MYKSKSRAQDAIKEILPGECVPRGILDHEGEQRKGLRKAPAYFTPGDSIVILALKGVGLASLGDNRCQSKAVEKTSSSRL